jgi:hypothetical protein
MNVLVTNLSAAEVVVPPPFGFTLGAAGGGSDTREVPIHIRDIVEYRANPARVDWLREIEQMVKNGIITITPAVALPIRDANDMDLEEYLISQAGGNFKQGGVLNTGGPQIAVTIPLNGEVATAAYRVQCTLQGAIGAVPFEITNLTTTSFDVLFNAAPYDGLVHWEITYPV